MSILNKFWKAVKALDDGLIRRPAGAVIERIKKTAIEPKEPTLGEMADAHNKAYDEARAAERTDETPTLGPD